MNRSYLMYLVKSPKRAVARFILGFGVLAAGSAAAQDVIAVANGVNMWDGQWHFEISPYAWAPWIYTSVQLPPIAGGGSPTAEVQPSQYLKHVDISALFDATLRKGDWALWTDLVYLNLSANPTQERLIALPGGIGPLTVTRTLDAGLRVAIWTLAPSYTVMNNSVGTLDVMAGIRYTSIALSLSYELNAPPLPVVGGGFWPGTDFTDGLIGVRGSLYLSRDGKWFVPYEADVDDGNKNWGNNEFLGVGYHFRWGDVSLGARNLTYQLNDRPILQKVRLTGPVIGATLRW
jgi:hypothetical protein